MDANLPVLALLGPTASGKTDLALQLARNWPVEIVSVDSGMVYCGMDIGTAKPSLQEQSEVPHHLIDIRDPTDAYSAAQFRHDAAACVAAIHARGRIPLLVGGTMLYFRVLRTALAAMPDADPAIRQALDEEVAAYGLKALYERLCVQDPRTAQRLQPTDRQRIQRALEVLQQTGRPLSYWHTQTPSEELPWHSATFWLGLFPEDRFWLHQRIERRLEQMWQRGFLEEVWQLAQRPDLHEQLPAMRAVGYRQALQHIQGHIDLETMRDRALFATRQLAKRQLTWMRSFAGAQWLDPSVLNTQTLCKELELVLKKAHNI